MKVVLIEFLATNRHNDVLLILAWLIKNEPLDKARACAVFAWAKQGWDDSRRGDAQKFLTDLWATVCDGTSSAGDAIVTLQLVYRPPAAAVERAVALIQNALELEQAWVDVDGGESLLTYQKDPHPVPITELVPEEHLPLIMEHIALHRQREPAVFAQPTSSVASLGLTPEQLALLPAHMQAEVARQLKLATHPDELCLPVGWEDLELSQLAFSALGDSDRCWAQPHAWRCLLERLSGQADPKPTRRLLYCLLNMMMADPLPEETSYYAPELDPALVQVLNELAFDDRYAAFWRVVDTFSQVEEKDAEEEEEEEKGEEAPLTNPFQLFGLPPDRSSLQAWLQTPLPPHVAGRKRFPHLAGLEAFAWDSVAQAYGSGVDLPKNIRRLVDSEPELRMSALYNIGISAFHQGTYYSSTPLVAKWISAVLDYEDSPDKPELVKFLLSLAGEPGQCNLAGFASGENPIGQPLALETRQEMLLAVRS
ncbi:uncharacterized protein ACA1_389170 [Acanthamoeba castellanii str. Neff]|uniref:Uncharacterized protein n=1 Tax=Acanthamoeba castellanii (strain ATCC 30010 / Neff) TaxID=1257118 RepID=L8GG98_ACACF|nr:uncharacterized protein ACA1_389170 [Acanthamoeba castellanii str. Neff]ELR11206.1 hypothetical protein ACA1_389170 [Acanthamoeba castellanii str. Neff]